MGILSDPAAYKSYNIFLSNFSEVRWTPMGKVSDVGSFELVRFAIDHDGLNSPENWEPYDGPKIMTGSFPATHRIATSRIDTVTERYLGVTPDYSKIKNGIFEYSDGYVYFNETNATLAPQGVAHVTGSKVIDANHVRVSFDVYYGSYDPRNEDLYAASVSTLKSKYDFVGPNYQGTADIKIGGSDSITDGKTLVSMTAN